MVEIGEDMNLETEGTDTCIKKMTNQNPPINPDWILTCPYRLLL